jgi:hypothetical protein
MLKSSVSSSQSTSNGDRPFEKPIEMAEELLIIIAIHPC